MSKVLWICKQATHLLTPKTQQQQLGQMFSNRFSSSLPLLMSSNHKNSLLSSSNNHSANGMTSQNHEMFKETSLSHGSCMQIRCYQNVLRPRLICEGCYFTWRHGRKHVECSNHPRHKQTKKLSPRKVWKEDYSIGDYKLAHDWNKNIHRAFYRTVDKTVMSHNWMADRIGKEV